MDDERNVIKVTSFAELQDNVTVNLEIERHDGSVMVIPIRELGYSDWVNVEREVPYPQPPAGGADNKGVPWYDNNNPDYRRKIADAVERRGYLRMLKAIQLDIPGETLDEKIDALASLPTEIILTVGTYLNEMHQTRKATVKARAASFQRDVIADDADLPQ